MLNTSVLREVSQEVDRYTQLMSNKEDKASSTMHTSGGTDLLMTLEGTVLVITIKGPPPLDPLWDLKILYRHGSISLVLILSVNQGSEMQIMSKDLLNVSHWNNGNLITGLHIFHTPTDIPLPFCKQGDEEPFIVIDGFWGVDIRFPEWGGDIGGNLIDDEVLGEVWDCELDWQVAILTKPDIREQSLMV